MVIDTSALLAILQNETERRAFNEAIEAAETRLLSAASFVESSIIVESRYGADGIRDLDLFIAKAQLELVAVDVEQAHLARQAFREFRQGTPPCRSQLRRLFLVRARTLFCRVASLQRSRFRQV